MENEDILYGYTGKKTDCKTRAWSPFLINSFWKCMIELKTFEAMKYFRRLAYSPVPNNRGGLNKRGGGCDR